MKVQVNSDKHIDVSAEFIEKIEQQLEDKLRRFASHISRIEVHLTDENSAAKSAGGDIRCRLEARLNAREPMIVTDHGDSAMHAINGSIGKLQSALNSVLGKLDSRRHSRPPEPLEE
jgi:ribosomal subunit interface protein